MRPWRVFSANASCWHGGGADAIVQTADAILN
jgi:hypothetical protein